MKVSIHRASEQHALCGPFKRYEAPPAPAGSSPGTPEAVALGALENALRESPTLCGGIWIVTVDAQVFTFRIEREVRILEGLG